MLKLAWANKGALDVKEMRQRGKLERKWGERTQPQWLSSYFSCYR